MNHLVDIPKRIHCFLWYEQIEEWFTLVTLLDGHKTVRLRGPHNWANSIARSPSGDPWFESCKNPAVIWRWSTHPASILQTSGKFSSQLKFAGRLQDASPLFLIRRRPVGHRPIPQRRSMGHRPKCSGKNPQVIEWRSGNLRPMTARWSPCHLTEIRRCL